MTNTANLILLNKISLIKNIESVLFILKIINVINTFFEN